VTGTNSNSSLPCGFGSSPEIVRINDRGPVPENRIIDLSYGAAKMLGMTENGIHPVRVELIDTPTISQNDGESDRVLMQDGRP